MVRCFTFNEPLVQISQVEWHFIINGIKLLVSAFFFSSIHCFLLGFLHHDCRGRVSVLCCIDLYRICAKLRSTWLKAPILVNTEALVIGASILSNTKIQGGEFDPLLSSISFTVIYCVLALVFLVLDEILIGLKDTNLKPALEGLTTYPYYFNFFWVLLRPWIFSPIVSGLSSFNCDDEVKSYIALADNL